MTDVILLGAGRAGRFHTETIRTSPRFRAVCVVDPEIERAETLAGRLGCRAMADAKQAFELCCADAAIIATTTSTHTALVQLALNHGMHVFCEKPLGTSEEIRDCYRLARERGRVLMVGFQRRFDPEFVALRESLGDRSPQLVKLTSRDSPIPPESYLRGSGGIVKDCVVHDIDIANWLMGGNASHAVPVTVFAAAYTHHPDLREWSEIEGLVATLQYGSGSIAVIDVSRTCNYGYDQRAEVFGPFGMLQVENRRATTLVAHTSEATVRSNPVYSFPERYPDAYRLELEHFADTFEHGVECRVTEAQVLATDRVADAIEAALASGEPQRIDSDGPTPAV